MQLTSSWQRFKAHITSWLIDHEIIRSLYRNFFSLSNNAYRSNQPSPGFVRKLKKKYGIKTIINLRRADNSGHFLLEKEACEQENIQLVIHSLSSRRFPKVENILKAKYLLETVQYPILIHCKSGADRAGLMSVFYMHFIQKQPLKDAVKQLSIKFGHFRWADTGKLDFFFDAFFNYQKDHPEIEFLDWVTNVYDREALDKQFHSSGWANIVVNKILRRE
ncbi:MAG: tyrosine-protein phosphatase [Thiomicrorhabdus chilensis]|uniref:fused DSP-PTPase phosphatase/NAD kinase-like protein n=1 Tax=Thiomicrorhabdus chilensis TaxID=63656 RepID=UPI00299DC89C|nr:tyrosine-protein phosphatase [Thiomicrorhabdus chilensis]MDX1347263.1 tyrosine-protein phosphatase [Thiomicrorhabdus chilensis]